MPTVKFQRFFSLDSPKAIKARPYGWLNAINYMAPADSASTTKHQFNLCPWSTAPCRDLCLGWHSGQAAMIKRRANPKTTLNNARRSRIAKSRMFMRDRHAFMAELVSGLEAAVRTADRASLRLCARLNGSTDIPWESIKLDPAKYAFGRTVFERFADIQFVDYTKSVKRMMRSLTDPTWPKNYHLTFSRSESNGEQCKNVLRAGGNVAVVFAGQKPLIYLDTRVVDGDAHDLRHLDPKGVVVALSPKGKRAKADTSGFVVRLPAPGSDRG